MDRRRTLRERNEERTIAKKGGSVWGKTDKEDRSKRARDIGRSRKRKKRGGQSVGMEVGIWKDRERCIEVCCEKEREREIRRQRERQRQRDTAIHRET